MAPQRNAHAFRRISHVIAIGASSARMRIASHIVDAFVAHPSNAETTCPTGVSRMHARTIRNGAT
jgi:hypothetical protein